MPDRPSASLNARGTAFGLAAPRCLVPRRSLCVLAGQLFQLTAGLAAVIVAAPIGAAQSDLRGLLRRAGEYVLQYHDSLTALVADEFYGQKVSSPTAGPPVERTLRSEFAIVRAEADDGWLAIRDILEVDGRPVEAASGIEALLKAPRARLRASAFAAASEQTKYNLGGVYRTINIPTLPLLFLLPDRQSRFRFRTSGTTTTSGIRLNVVHYEERERPTIIRTPNGRSIVSRGTFWIDPSNGQVRKTELVTNEPRDLKAVITVTYEYEERLNLLVPATMDETYVTSGEQITARATYSNFRRFETEARVVR